MPTAIIIIAVLILVILILLITNIKIVPQSMVFVVERLGAYQQTWETGLHFKVPFIDRVAKRVSLKEQVVDFKPPAGHHPRQRHHADRQRRLLSDHRRQAVHLRRRAPDLRD